MWSRASKIVGLAVVLGLGITVLVVHRSNSTQGRASMFATANVDRGRIVAKVTASGTLSPLVTVQVGSQVSGRIQKILVDFNSPVSKGQVIARIDPRLLEGTEQEARANYTASQGNLAKAKSQALEAATQYARSKSLAEQKLIDEADLETTRTNDESATAQVEAAQGALEQAAAALHEAEANLEYATIVSPIDGVVISRNVDVGQTVAASLQAPTLFVIAEDLRKMQVDTSVAEADVGKLQPGLQAVFTVDAYPNETFHGVVRQVRNAAQVVQNVVTYDAVIDVDNPDQRLKPGMTANVNFVYADRKNTLRVPNAALRFRPTGAGTTTPHQASLVDAAPSSLTGGGESNRRTVWVLHGDRPIPVTVQLGVTDGTFSEVTSSELHEADRVVTDIVGDAADVTARRSRADAFRRMF